MNIKHITLICLAIFALSLGVYSNTLKGDFIWDDEYLILKNSQVKSFNHVGNAFKTYVGYGSENVNNFYRPLQEISNMIDYSVWGEDPFGFHLTNNILHALVSVTVFIFLLYLTGDMLVAGIAGLFYCVHPVHTEAVAYIAGRADPLYSLFMLLSLVFFIAATKKTGPGKNRHTFYLLSILFFVLSLLSKELVIVLPLLIFLYIIYFLKDEGDRQAYRRFKWSWAPYAAIVAIYGLLRLTVLNFAGISPVSAYAQIPFVHRVLTFLRTLFVYARLMVLPFGLHMERTITVTGSIFEPAAILAIAMLFAAGWIIYKTYNGNRLVSFALAWFFINLLPVANLVPINSFLAEHWMYMASVGLFLLFGMGAARIYRKLSTYGSLPGGVFLTALSVLLVFYSVLTVSRNTAWRNEITFFNDTLKYHPSNARLYLNLGNTYYEKGDTGSAIEQYEKAIEVDERYAIAYGNIGSAYLSRKEPAKAEEYLRKALSLKDNYPIARYNLGIINYKRKKYKEALNEFNKAVEQLPQLYQAWNMIGRTYLKMREIDKAGRAFHRSLEIMPGQEKVRLLLDRINSTQVE